MVTRAPRQAEAVILPGGEEMPLPVAPADVPQSVVNLLLRTVLRNSSGRDDDQDPYDVDHARLLGAGLIAHLIDAGIITLPRQDQPATSRSRRRRPAAEQTGMSALF